MENEREKLKKFYKLGKIGKSVSMISIIKSLIKNKEFVEDSKKVCELIGMMNSSQQDFIIKLFVKVIELEMNIEEEKVEIEKEKVLDDLNDLNTLSAFLCMSNYSRDKTVIQA